MKNSRILLIFIVIVIALFSSCAPENGNGKVDDAHATSSPSEEIGRFVSSVQSVLDTKKELRFDSNGEFKVVFFSDLLQGTTANETDIANIIKVLDRESPSLVILSGDIHDGSIKNETELRALIDSIVRPIEERKIPWCNTMGVLTEGTKDNKTGFARADQMKVYQSYEYCLSETSVGDIYGVSNYVLPVIRSDNDKIGYNIWCIDSNSYLNDYMSGLEEQVILNKTLSGNTDLDRIHFSQLLWYANTSALLEQYNGSKVPGIMCFQIPPYQFSYIYKNADATGRQGTAKNKVSASEADSGVVWTCYERGDIKGIFCGYDIANDYSGTYLDMLLACTSTITDKGDGATSGARVVKLSQDGSVESYMVYKGELG